MPNADFAKWPKPVDIARVILFLCSEDAKVVRGASIPVYGDSVCAAFEASVETPRSCESLRYT